MAVTADELKRVKEELRRLVEIVEGLENVAKEEERRAGAFPAAAPGARRTRIQ